VREGACIGAATMLQPWTLRLKWLGPTLVRDLPRTTVHVPSTQLSRAWPRAAACPGATDGPVSEEVG